jgi:hypothetical protein
VSARLSFEGKAGTAGDRGNSVAKIALQQQRLLHQTARPLHELRPFCTNCVSLIDALDRLYRIQHEHNCVSTGCV